MPERVLAVTTPAEWALYALAVRDPRLLDEAERFSGVMLAENQPAIQRVRALLAPHATAAEPAGVPAASNAGRWLKELRGCLDSSAHFDRGATVYQAVDALEAMLADRVAEVDRLTAERDAAIRRAEASDAVVRGARSLWGSWAFCAPEAIAQMAARKLGAPLSEYEAERTGSPASGGADAA